VTERARRRSSHMPLMRAAKSGMSGADRGAKSRTCTLGDRGRFRGALSEMQKGETVTAAFLSLMGVHVAGGIVTPIWAIRGCGAAGSPPDIGVGRVRNVPLR
jgi:hypothetical protein